MTGLLVPGCRARAVFFATLLTLGGCGESHVDDAGAEDAARSDAGDGSDAGRFDAGRFDAGFDAGPGDDAALGDAAPGDDAGGATDAGFDAGNDAGLDAGNDAGFDAGADAGADAGPGADGGVCSIVGDYRTVFSGITLFLRFRADGTWAGAMSRAGLATSTIGGTYMLTGSTLTIVDGASGMTGCAPTQVGTYTVMWSPTCGTATLALVSDPCTDRAMALAGAVFTRL